MNGYDVSGDIALLYLLIAIAALVLLVAAELVYRVRRWWRRKHEGQEWRDYCKRAMRMAAEGMEIRGSYTPERNKVPPPPPVRKGGAL